MSFKNRLFHLVSDMYLSRCWKRKNAWFLEIIDEHKTNWIPRLSGIAFAELLKDATSTVLPSSRLICFLSKYLLHLGRSHRVSSASMRSSSLSRNFIIAFNVQCDCESIDVLRGNVVRNGCEWERKEASVLKVVRGFDGNSSLYMVIDNSNNGRRSACCWCSCLLGPIWNWIRSIFILLFLVPTGYRQTTKDQDHLVFFKKSDSTRAGTR